MQVMEFVISVHLFRFVKSCQTEEEEVKNHAVTPVSTVKQLKWPEIEPFREEGQRREHRHRVRHNSHGEGLRALVEN